jgi:hypothetical protein
MDLEEVVSGWRGGGERGGGQKGMNGKKRRSSMRRSDSSSGLILQTAVEGTLTWVVMENKREGGQTRPKGGS